KPDPRGKPWDDANPTSFVDVKATDRLSFDEARGLALQNVFRTYRVDDVGVNPPPRDERQRIYVQGYGYVKDRYHLILQGTKVEQVKPGVRDEAQGGRASTLPPRLEYYDGFSRDQEAKILGKVRNGTVKNWWAAIDQNA